MEDNTVPKEICEIRSQSLEKRVEKHGEDVDDIKLCIVRLTQMVESHEERIKMIEKRPRDLWGKVLTALISASVTAFVSFLISYFTK